MTAFKHDRTREDIRVLAYYIDRPAPKVQPWTLPWEAEYMEVGVMEHRFIQGLGNRGIQLVEAEAMTIPEISEQLEDGDTYAFSVPASITSEALAAFFENKGAAIRRPKTTAYGDYDTASFTDPVILACPHVEGGDNKYLIETKEQLDKVNCLAAELRKGVVSGELSKIIEVREYIPTPSDRYTSYRIVASASGDIFAAGLLYSDHKQADKKVISSPTAHWPIQWGDSVFEGLESPRSPYFLGARDARSNLSQGGHVIPLMGGEAARKVTSETEQAILLAHGIDPSDIQVPTELLEQASLMARNVAKFYGVSVGIDFLQHAETGDFYHLENNAGPGGDTVVACWAGNTDEPATLAQAQRAIYEHSFASIVPRS